MPLPISSYHLCHPGEERGDKVIRHKWGGEKLVVAVAMTVRAELHTTER